MKFELPFRDEMKPNEIATTPEFLTAFAAREKSLPVGHEALQGYLDGANDVTNELKRLVLQHPDLPEPFKTNLLDLIANRDKYYRDMEALWDFENDGVGFKGLTPAD